MMKRTMLTYLLTLCMGFLPGYTNALTFEEARAIFDSGNNNNASADNAVVPDGLPVDDGDSTESLTDETSDKIDGDLERQSGESEPNNSVVSADPLTSDRPIIGQLYAEEDEDWFFIETTGINEIILMSMPVSDGSWNISVLDSAGNLFASSDNIAHDINDVVTSLEGLSEEDETFNFAVTVARPGAYYIVIRPPSRLPNPPPVFSAVTYQLTVTIEVSVNPNDPVVNVNFHDVETEPNNGIISDRTFRTDRLASNVAMYGQLHSLGDEDWYEINSPGDEIITVEICWDNSICDLDGNGRLQNRVVHVIAEPTSEDDKNDFQSGGSIFCDGEVLPLFPGIELLAHNHFIDDILLGRLSPDVNGLNTPDDLPGDKTRRETTLEIGLEEAGKYYIVVSNGIARPDPGSACPFNLVLVEIERDEETDTIKKISGPFVIYNADDDQYALRVTRTQLSPSVFDSPEHAAERARAVFDSKTEIISIPQLEYNGEIFEADLHLISSEGTMLYELIDLTPVE